MYQISTALIKHQQQFTQVVVNVKKVQQVKLVGIVINVNLCLPNAQYGKLIVINKVFSFKKSRFTLIILIVSFRYFF